MSARGRIEPARRSHHRLHAQAIDPTSAAGLARLRYGDDTDVLFLEVKHGSAWLRIEAMDETLDSLSIVGAVSSASTLVVVLNTRGHQGISYGDTTEE